MRDARRSDARRDGKGADLGARHRSGRLVRDECELRLLDRPRHRVRLSPDGSRSGGHAGRDRVLRRTSPCGGRRRTAVGSERYTAEGVNITRKGEGPLAIKENPEILLYTRIRKSPYFYASRQHGVQKYSVYNHTYHPRHYVDPV